MIVRVLLYVLIILVHFNVSAALAQNRGSDRFNSDTGYEDAVLPRSLSTSVIIDDDDQQPNEPNITEIKFLKFPPLNSLGERVDRLILGIEKDIPPEYDHYGYEIRRYMARVGNIKIFSDKDFLEQQIKNVKKARIIGDYWKRKIDKEMMEIEEILAKDQDVHLRIRTSYRQNKATIRTFLIVLKSWIDANERLLKLIQEDPSIYEVIYPEIIIFNSKSRLAYYNSMLIKQQKLIELQDFRPFEMMMY